MGKQHVKYPPHDEIVRQVVSLGGYGAAARALGVSRTTLQDYCARHGLKERIAELRVTEREFDPEAAPEEVAVSDPLRVRNTQLTAENKKLKRENRDYEAALASQEEFFDRIVEASRVPVDVPTFTTAKQDAKKPSRSIIAPIYDLQYGQLVRPEDTPANRGGFNRSVFDERLERYIEGLTGVIRKQAEAYKMDELIFALGGDFVEGDEIFAGQPWQLEMHPIQQVIECSEKLAAAMSELIRFAKEEVGIKTIRAYGVPGNHGKVGGRKSGARPADYSFDYLVLKMLEDKLSGQPIDEWGIEPAGHLLFGCAEFTFLMIHGDQIKGWGGLPFYGLTKFDGRAIRLHNVIHDYLLMGHHHQAANIPNGSGESIVSGDWVGANNLSAHMTAGSRPHQSVIFVGKKWGITAMERIWFSKAEQAYAPSPVYEGD